MHVLVCVHAVEGEKIPTPTEIDASIKVASAKAAGLPTPQEIDSAIAAGRRSMRTVPTPEETETLVQAALAAGVKPMPNPADVNALVSKVKEASASGRRSMCEYTTLSLHSPCWRHLT